MFTRPDETGDRRDRGSLTETLLLIFVAFRILVPVLAAIIVTVLVAYGLFVVFFG